MLLVFVTEIDGFNYVSPRVSKKFYGGKKRQCIPQAWNSVCGSSRLRSVTNGELLKNTTSFAAEHCLSHLSRSLSFPLSLSLVIYTYFSISHTVSHTLSIYLSIYLIIHFNVWMYMWFCICEQ